jgi:hypothetical protein
MIFCNSNKFPVIATVSFRCGLPRQMAGLLLFICYMAGSDGLATDAVAPPLEGSVLEASCIFAAGSRKNGTWDPDYFKFFRTPAQVREKVAHQERRKGDWGGVLLGVYKPSITRSWVTVATAVRRTVRTAW